MTPIIFKTKLAWLKLDAAEFAREIDVPVKQVEAWRTGKRKVPVMVARLINLMGRNARLEAGTTYPNGDRTRRKR